MAINIKLFQISTRGGLNARNSRLQRRFVMSSLRFLKKCLDLMSSYELIQLKYKLLFNTQTVSVISEEVYREIFTGIMLMHKDLVSSYGKNLDNFINSSRDIGKLVIAQKKYFERVVDMYLMMQKEYAMMELLFQLPFSTQQLPSDNTSLVSISAESIKKYTNSKQKNDSGNSTGAYVPGESIALKGAGDIYSDTVSSQENINHDGSLVSKAVRRFKSNFGT